MLPDGSGILGQNKLKCRSLHLLTACVMSLDSSQHPSRADRSGFCCQLKSWCDDEFLSCFGAVNRLCSGLQNEEEFVFFMLPSVLDARSREFLYV